MLGNPLLQNSTCGVNVLCCTLSSGTEALHGRAWANGISDFIIGQQGLDGAQEVLQVVTVVHQSLSHLNLVRCLPIITGGQTVSRLQHEPIYGSGRTGGHTYQPRQLAAPIPYWSY